MQQLVEKLKSMKNATVEQHRQVIKKYAHAEVLKELKNAGLSKDDISQSEFDDLLEEKTKQADSFSKGALAAGGAMLFLELLG
ncbi:MAG: hypothetical protein PHX44_08460 [Sulfurimonas sp.]|uniref:hypothetical protein n=1 Tax=Sulfurimonas sp. TaxID=2022749 RepID=UPI0026329018|nr:hypothetical protein [Sulfurimonas sp.]MDD2653065.1 hypothetical protein [Sulfurimonas sp.]MDD3452512.1 hypothetical protein [Sulfurimonas sp.]